MAGVLGLVISSMRYWSHLQDVYRFTLLGVALAILIWVGYKKIGSQGKNEAKNLPKMRLSKHRG